MAAMDIADMSQPDDLTNQAISVQLTLLRQASSALKLRLEAMDALALSKAKAGGIIPGYVTERGRGGRDWTGPPEMVRALGASMGVQVETTKLLSPHQTEQAGLSKELVKTMVKSTPGKLKLVPGDPAAEVRRLFNEQPN